MSQRIEHIKIEDLVLWTENPRDPIDGNASDQDIVNKAVLDKNAKWTLKKLSKEMGSYYDFSELPTVVYVSGRPIVYDGNRRMILAKIKHNLVSIGNYQIETPEVPEVIPCNVCSESIALQNVYRKHAESGSWDPLERDIFLHKFMGEKKSSFLLFDENTNGFISSHPVLNQGFVKKEILNDKGLSELGFSFDKEQMLTLHSKEELVIVLQDLLQKVTDKKISTRTNRGEILNVLDTRTREIIEQNKDQEYRIVDDFCDNSHDADVGVAESSQQSVQRRTRRVKSTAMQLFGGPLYLKAGDINNLYRDICEIYDYYESNKTRFTDSFFPIVRMSMRLLCESASNDMGLSKIDDYINKYCSKAKTSMSQNVKTFLSNQNVSQQTIVQLLHTGAHNYSASKSHDQTLAVSILLGAILSLSHGKK